MRHYPFARRIFLTAFAVGAGCLMTQCQGRNDEREILAVVDSLEDALRAGSSESWSESFADDFLANDGSTTKEQILTAIDAIIAVLKQQGLLDEVEFDREEAVFEREGNRIAYGPVAVRFPTSLPLRTFTASLRATFEKRDGQWLIVSGTFVGQNQAKSLDRFFDETEGLGLLP